MSAKYLFHTVGKLLANKWQKQVSDSSGSLQNQSAIESKKMIFLLIDLYKSSKVTETFAGVYCQNLCALGELTSFDLALVKTKATR